MRLPGESGGLGGRDQTAAAHEEDQSEPPPAVVLSSTPMRSGEFTFSGSVEMTQGQRNC